MRTGLFLGTLNPIVDPDFLAALAEAANEGCFSSIWVGEHVVQFDDHKPEYPYSPDGRMPITGETGLLEPFTTLAFLAALAPRIRIGTAICLLPQRNPVYSAKEASTLDWLSGGRFDFGIGIGWCREEFEALGVPFDGRARRCAEYVEVMRRLWTEEVSSYEGSTYRLPPSRMYPKPVQHPHPPLYFGGESDPALRRVAEMGDGWFGFDVSAAEAGPMVRRLEGALALAGRRITDVDVTVSPYLRPVERDDLPLYRDAGVDQLVVSVPLVPADRLGDALGRLADQLVTT